jgi:hypothetical protein
MSELVNALRRLSPNQRAAIVLRHVLDLDTSEVARRMGTVEATVRVHLHRGRRRLRELLGALGRLDALMEQGVDVVLDDTNNLRMLRDRFRNVALEHGYATRLLYLVPPPEVLHARTRGGTGNRTLSLFEAPQPDESPIVLDQVREPMEQAVEIAAST